MIATYTRLDDQDYRFDAKRAEGRIEVSGRTYRAWSRLHGWHWKAEPTEPVAGIEPRRQVGHGSSRKKAVEALMRMLDPMPGSFVD